MGRLEFWTIRLLRRLPITVAFDAHLTRCAYADALFDENLTLGKLLRWSPLESGIGELDAGFETVQAPKLRRDREARDRCPVVAEGFLFQHESKSVH